MKIKKYLKILIAALCLSSLTISNATAQTISRLFTERDALALMHKTGLTDKTNWLTKEAYAYADLMLEPEIGTIKFLFGSGSSGPFQITNDPAGISKMSLFAEILDRNGNPLEGVPIYASTNLGVFFSFINTRTLITDQDGHVGVSFESLEVGTATITFVSNKRASDGVVLSNSIEVVVVQH